MALPRENESIVSIKWGEAGVAGAYPERQTTCIYYTTSRKKTYQAKIPHLFNYFTE
jgi:hypothetical protein